MGYYTRYELSYKLPECYQSESVKAFVADCHNRGISIPVDIREAFDEKLSLEIELEKTLEEETPSGYGPWKDFVNGQADSCTWYDHASDMQWLSKKFPTVLFTLKGEGEESGDLWVKYFRDGKMQECRAQVAFPPFDANELK